MDDEERAAAYRTQQAARVQWERDNAVRLRGDPTASAAVRAAWQPFMDARQERYDVEPEPIEYHDRDRWSAA